MLGGCDAIRHHDRQTSSRQPIEPINLQTHWNVFLDESFMDDPITQCLSYRLRDHQVYTLLQESCRYLHATTVIAPGGSIRRFK